MNTIRSKAVHGFFWSAMERGGNELARFLVGIFLARLLLPEDFGLIALMSVFMVLARSLIDSGFSQAIIRQKEVSDLALSSVFWLNVVLGGALTGVIYILSPLIASFYNQPSLIPIARLVSLCLFINSFGIIQNALLSKEIDFKRQFKANLGGTCCSGLVGVAMAFSGMGVLSLVAHQLLGDALRILFLWSQCTWRPKLAFSLGSLKSMFGFGSKLLASGLLNILFDEIYTVIIGKMYSPASLGLYNRARTLQQMPIVNLWAIAGRVLLPIFSRQQHDPTAMLRSFKQTITCIAFISFTAMAVLFASSRPLVHFVLSAKWLPCVPYLQLFCLAGVLYPLSAIHLNILLALGRSDLFLKLEILKKFLVLAAVCLTFRFGVTAMIIGHLIVSILSYGINCYYTVLLLNYRPSDQLRDLLPVALVPTAAGGLAYIIGMTADIGNLSMIILQGFVFLIALIALSLLCKIDAFHAIRRVVSEALPEKWIPSLPVMSR